MTASCWETTKHDEPPGSIVAPKGILVSRLLFKGLDIWGIFYLPFTSLDVYRLVIFDPDAVITQNVPKRIHLLLFYTLLVTSRVTQCPFIWS